MGDDVALSVVIPAFDESARLPATLDDLVTHLRVHVESFEVIVSDDGSTDGTADLVHGLARDTPELRLISSPRNKGKGHAVKIGLREAVGRRVLFCDADGATPITQLTALEAGLVGGADIAVGSRALAGDGIARSTKLHRRVMGRAFANLFTRGLARGIRDTQCGFKLFTAEAAKGMAEHLSIHGFAFDLEIFVIARNLGFAVTEVPVSWNDVDGSKVRLVRDSIAMARDAAKIRRRAGAGYYRL